MVPATSEYDTSFAFLPPRGLYEALASALTGSSGSPNASHNFPTCDCGKSCFGFFGSVDGVLAGRWLPGSGASGLCGLSAIMV